MNFPIDDGIYLNGRMERYEFIFHGKVYKTIKNKQDADDLISELNCVAKIINDNDNKSANRVYEFIECLKKLDFQ